MPHYSAEFIKDMPKSDLHLHLDGSLRLESLIEMAKRSGVQLPADTVAGLKSWYLKINIKTLANTYIASNIPARCCATWII